MPAEPLRGTSRDRRSFSRSTGERWVPQAPHRRPIITRHLAACVRAAVGLRPPTRRSGVIVSGHMPRTRLLARAITAALLISAACGPSNVAKPPAPTAPGSPTGDPNRGTVGDGGGN